MKICPVCNNVYADSLQSCPRDQTPLVALDEGLRAGDLLRGKYEVIEELGRGGMATVYKVRHLTLREIFAVKLVHTELLADQEFLKRFRNEAVVARQLRHPNAVQIQDFDFSDAGQPFIVMEYIHGRSLYDARRELPQAWPADMALRLSAGVAAALEAAHDLGIVHRDIKPANILLARSPEGREIVKVSDFGIAKVDERAFAGMTSVKTQANMIIGTPEYMSPEQAMASDLSKIDGRSDLYSLGMVLYELLTGAHPFRADTPIAMLMHQVQTQPSAPHVVEVSISPAVSALILKALRKNPEERFQTAGEMLEALNDPDGWYRRHGTPLAARPVHPGEDAPTALLPVPDELAALRRPTHGSDAAPRMPIQDAVRPAGGARAASPRSTDPSNTGPSSRQTPRPPNPRPGQNSRAPSPFGGNMADPRIVRQKRGSGGTILFLLLLALAACGVYYYLQSEGLLHSEARPAATPGAVHSPSPASAATRHRTKPPS